MSDDDRLDRDAIQKRRALLIASAMLGIAACSSREPPPEPCLSPPYDPAIHGPPVDGPPDPPGAGGAGGAAPTASASAAITDKPPPLACLSVQPPPSTKTP